MMTKLSLKVAPLACLALLCLGTPTLAEGQDWATFLGPHANGVSTETGFVNHWDSEGPTVAWRAEVGTGFASVAVVGDRLYAIGNDDGDHETVTCINIDTGETIWTHRYTSELVDNLHEGGSGATPVVHDGAVYVISRIGEVRSVNAETGDLNWRFGLSETLGMEMPTWGYTSSVVIDEGVGYIQAGATLAFDLETGEEIWRSKTYKPTYTTPQVFDFNGERHVAVLNAHGLVILKAADGSEVAASRWRTQYDASAPTPLLLEGDRFFVTSGYYTGSTLIELSEAGELSGRYENKAISAHMDTPVPRDGYVYGFDGNHNRPDVVDLVCVEMATGEVIWRHNGYGCGAITLAGETLIILSDTGTLVTAEATPDGFRRISEAKVLEGRCWTAPVFAHGRVFARNAAGDLVCVDLRP
ncbi:MAG: PQQ-binding-like beta-propeller repeat protein [Phycisphaeraceae bacterium]